MSLKEPEPTQLCPGCNQQFGIESFKPDNDCCKRSSLILRKQKSTEINTLKQNQKCEKCGYHEHWQTLEFVIKDEKKHGKMILEDMKQIDLFSLLCQMCKTDVQRQKTRANYVKHKSSANDFKLRKREQIINAVKVDKKKCCSCEAAITPQNAHQFKFGVALGISGTKRKIAEIKAELLEAEVRCANCFFVEKMKPRKKQKLN